MENSIRLIDYTNLALAFVPVLAVVGILYKWSIDYKNALYAVSRMLIQLLLIGYVLVYIFQAENSLVVLAVLGVMLFASAWIALRTIKDQRHRLVPKALGAIFIGGGLTLVLITQDELNE